MAMNFHDARNRMSYATRTADESWLACMRKHVDLTGKQAADVGCGGGIYAKGLIQAGAAHVTAVDFSVEMLRGGGTELSWNQRHQLCSRGCVCNGAPFSAV